MPPPFLFQGGRDNKADFVEGILGSSQFLWLGGNGPCAYRTAFGNSCFSRCYFKKYLRDANWGRENFLLYPSFHPPRQRGYPGGLFMGLWFRTKYNLQRSIQRSLCSTARSHVSKVLQSPGTVQQLKTKCWNIVSSQGTSQTSQGTLHTPLTLYLGGSISKNPFSIKNSSYGKV